MSYYTSGYYVYFNNMRTNHEIKHLGFILNPRHYMYITSPLGIMEKMLVSYLGLFVKKILELWMNNNIQIVAQLSKVNV